MYSDLTGYKFSQSLEDLTRSQMYFLTTCAVEHQKVIDEAMSKSDYSNYSSNSNSKSKLPTVNDTDSYETQRAKIDAIKAQMRRG